MKSGWIEMGAGALLLASCTATKDTAPQDAGADAAPARSDSASSGSSSLAAKGGTGGNSVAGRAGSEPERPAANGGSGSAGRGGDSAPAAGGAGAPGKHAMTDAAGRRAPDANTGHDEDAGIGDPSCRARVAVRAAGTATVWLVIDASGSMVDALGATTRWDALRDALLSPTSGVVKALQGELQWGLMLFDGPLTGSSVTVLPDGGTLEFPAGPATSCPRTQLVEPQLNNFAALEAAFPALPLGGSTPTDKALQQLANRYAADSGSGPVSVVLATDGAPNDFCSTSTFPPDVRPYVVQNVKQLLASGITTYALSLAAGDQNLSMHLAEVSAAGGTGKPVFTPADSDALTTALREIVGKETGCSVRLQSRIALANACEGAVGLDGQALACDDANGFKLHDEVTLQLNGEACDRYRSLGAGKLEIAYPCAALLK